MSTRRIAVQTAALLAAAAALVGVPVAHAASGGPDWYGYTWQDTASGGPAYDYVFAPDSATLAAEDSLSITLPFAFEFYGVSYTEARVQSNGALTFGLGSTLTSSNQCLSGSSYTMIAPWWDDLDPSAGTVYYGSTGTAGSRVYIVEWYLIQHDNTPGEITFELKLFEADNHVEFHYEDVTTDSSSYSFGSSATVGLSDSGGGSQISCNAAGLSTEWAVGFYPPTGTTCPDLDFDGYTDSACGGQDCDDSNGGIFPGAVDACDGLDNDCDFMVDEGHDSDVDGWTWCDGDCDDTEPTVNPSQWEDSSVSCFDGLDNDCDGWWDLDDVGCSDFIGDDDDATGDDDDATGDDDDATGDDDDDDDATGDDDDATGDDDDATGDDDDATGDDDDATGDDDDATGDDDDSATGDDDDDDDGGRGGGGRGGRACSQGDTAPGSPLTALLFAVLSGLARRRTARR